MYEMHNVHREAIESTYIGKCDIIESVRETNGSRTKEVEKVVEQDIPCRLSRSSNSRNPTNQTDTTNNIDYNSLLFINPEIEVRAGSKIIVTQNGRTLEFIQAGETALYITHQETPLKRIDKA